MLGFAKNLTNPTGIKYRKIERFKTTDCHVGQLIFPVPGPQLRDLCAGHVSEVDVLLLRGLC